MGKFIRAITHLKESIDRIILSRRLNVNYIIHARAGTEVIGSQYVHIGKGFCTGKDVLIEAWDHHIDERYSPEIIIGDRVFINNRSHISAIHKLIIGDDVLIGSDVLICDNNHGATDMKSVLSGGPRVRKLTSKGSITVHKNVWIGDKAIILSGVTVGEGSIVGAASVVTKDVPEYSVVCGNPARVIKLLNNEEKK